MRMHDFRKLLVWQLARELGIEIYRHCATRPSRESAITSQLRRSALAIATNIAEGCGKASRAESVRYLDIAAGSAAETEHHLEVLRDVGGLDARSCDELVARVTAIRRMLHGLVVKLPR